MTLQMLYILTIASFICSTLSLAANYSVKMDDFYSGVRYDEQLYPCESDADCARLTHPKCRDAFCACPEDTVCPDLEIISEITLGERCGDMNVTCDIDNAHCSDYGLCECDDGFVASSTNNTCLQSNRKLGEECVENYQCYTHFCRNNVCTRPVDLGAKCRSTKQCNTTVDFSHCVNGTCDCLERFVSHEGRCYLAARDFLSSCEVDVQCRKVMGIASECIEKKCVCSTGFVYNSLARECLLHDGASSASFKWIPFKVIAFSVFIVKCLL